MFFYFHSFSATHSIRKHMFFIFDIFVFQNSLFTNHFFREVDHNLLIKIMTTRNLNNIFDLEAQCSDDSDESYVESVHQSDIDFIVDDDETISIASADTLLDDTVADPHTAWVPNPLAAWFLIHQVDDYHEYFVDVQDVPTIDKLMSLRVEFDWYCYFDDAKAHFSERLQVYGSFEEGSSQTSERPYFRFDLSFRTYKAKLYVLHLIAKHRGWILWFDWRDESDQHVYETPQNELPPMVLPHGITGQDLTQIAQDYDDLGGNRQVTPEPEYIDLTEEDAGDFIDLTNDD